MTSARSCRRRPGRRAARSGRAAVRVVRVGHQPPGVRVERVRRQLAGGRVLASPPGTSRRSGGPAGRASSAARVRITGRRVRRVGQRPDLLVVERTPRTALARARDQPLDHHQRVVVAVRGEGRRRAGAAALGRDPRPAAGALVSTQMVARVPTTRRSTGPISSRAAGMRRTSGRWVRIDPPTRRAPCRHPVAPEATGDPVGARSAGGGRARRAAASVRISAWSTSSSR